MDIVATPDGKTLVSAALNGLLEIQRQGLSPKRLQLDQYVRCLAIHPSGNLLVAGTYPTRDAPSQVMGIDLSGRSKVLWKLEGGNQTIRTCVISPNGTKLAYGMPGARNLILRALKPGGQLGRELYVADRPGWLPREVDLEASRLHVTADRGRFAFDPVKLSLKKIDAAGGQTDRAQGTGRRSIDLGGGLQALADRASNDIIVYRTGSPKPKVQRRFRGHQDAILWLCVSEDRKYLISASYDGTIRYWSLSGLDKGAGYRWGATLKIVDDSLRVTDLEPAGLLFREGARENDVIKGIEWFDSSRQQQRTIQPQAMKHQLESADWQTAIRFEIAGRKFTRKPAWSELCSLLVTASQEWIFWTPEGYYAASTEGNRLIGWLVRRGVDKQPLFFRADQVRHAYERPLVLAQLLESGSLDAALRAAAPEEARRRQQLSAIARQIPTVTIETPTSKLLEMGERVEIQCRIQLPEGAEIDRKNVRLFANGVHGRVTRLQQRGQTVELTGNIALPADENIDLQVRAWVNDLFGEAHTRLNRVTVPEPARRSLHSFLAAANDYERFGDLRYCINDIRAMEHTLRTQPGFDSVVAPIRSENFKKQSFHEQWKTFVDQVSTAEIAPDDVILVYASAHGYGAGTRYYLAGIDGKFKPGGMKAADSADDSTLIRLDELLADLASVQCRKVVVLDTCRAGTLLAAIRELQDDLIFAVTACRENENSAEYDGEQLGYFTHSFIRGLEGAADRNNDGAILLSEICDFVEQDVPDVQRRVIGRVVQHPQHFPKDLIRNTSILLTKSAAPSVSPASVELRKPDEPAHGRISRHVGESYSRIPVTVHGQRKGADVRFILVEIAEGSYAFGYFSGVGSTQPLRHSAQTACVSAIERCIAPKRNRPKRIGFQTGDELRCASVERASLRCLPSDVSQGLWLIGQAAAGLRLHALFGRLTCFPRRIYG